MKERRPWQCIDFWDKGPSKKHHQSEAWLFPAREEDILNLLKTNAGSALLEIHLRFVSANILNFLRENCPNLQVFSFLPRNITSFDELYSYKSLLCDQHVSKTFSDFFIIPPKVTECRINFLASYNKQTQDGHRQSITTSFIDDTQEQQADDILRRLSKCRQLKYLALHSFNFTLLGAKILSEAVTNLQELCLVDAKVLDEQEQEDVFRTFVTNFTDLKVFKFSGYGNVDFVLEEVVGWSSLRELWLGRLKFTEDAFIEMTSKMPQLEILGLDCIISDQILDAIANNLPNVQELSLVGGEYSDVGLNCLRNNLALKKLYISDYHIEKGPEFSLQTVYRVIKSLPMIEWVTISCQRLQKRYSGEILPEINKPNLKVQIDYY